MRARFRLRFRSQEFVGLRLPTALYLCQNGHIISYMTMKRKPMDRAKLERVRAKGWKSGSAAEFLGLIEGEAALVEMKVSLSDAVRRSRKRHGITQVDLANRLDSSQSRIAKLEAGDPGVSLDLLVRAALAAGAKKSEVAAAILGKTLVTQ